MPELAGAIVGLMTIFLFFVAVILTGEGTGECPYCDHCRDLRRARLGRRAWENHPTPP
jgi:hypothetical protein